MPNYQTPGVYVEEVDAFPPSVVGVATAIPAFIGSTKKAVDADGASLLYKPTRIKNMLEYEAMFGKAKNVPFKVTLHGDVSKKGMTVSAGSAADFNCLVYYSLKHYFLNGGGPCYIVSIRTYGDEPANQASYDKALKALEKVDEVTLLLPTDAVHLDPANYYTIAGMALSQCHKLQDRFTILDVLDEDEGEYFADTYGVEEPAKDGKGIDAFRNNVSTYLDYGAAYYPYLKTTLPYAWDEAEVELDGNLTKAVPDGDPEVVVDVAGKKLADIKEENTEIYNAIKAKLGKQTVLLPPSAAMAGIYARTDNDRGVWKAPAGSSDGAVVGLTGPLKLITNEDQENMNIDSTSGKSINAIRTFTGKGTLVWGARTLMGNDNNWRYINVRRLFIMVEESCKKATEFAVFEPNDAGTWLKIKAMLQSFLFQLWQKGALVGPTPDSAYEVNVGLGVTMTEQDILEGRMNIEVKFAPSRPAEFIVLSFSQLVQKA